MTREQLRITHPKLVYKQFTIAHSNGVISVTYDFLLEPDISLRSKISIPFFGSFDAGALAPYVFHLGLVEAISYWKLATPKEFVVEAGSLSEEQIRFWYDLFIHGLGEFYYRNQIDFTAPGFLKISSNGTNRPNLINETNLSQREQDLVLVGGGKDSAVTLGMMSNSDRTLQTMVLNPTRAALDTIRAALLPGPLIVHRSIDPKMLELNRAGYLNGHTPFSAYLAFLGVLVASLYGNENVIVSNEKSANEGNVSYLGLEVNHQYSKSFRFETMFRQYSTSVFEDAASYFSMLRPLNDVQIGMVFATYPQFFPTFRSCNVGSKTGVWCGACAKCAFTYLTLSPFLPEEQMRVSFGADVFANPSIIEHIRALVGLTPVKPFECVGTRDEAKLAVILTVGKYLKDGREVPEGLLKIKSDLDLSREDIAELHHIVLDDWGDTYNVPPEHISLLRSVWQSVALPV